MSEKPGLIVIGLGPGGMAAVKAFREQDSEMPVTVITSESMTCYSRPRLPEVVSGKASLASLCLYPDKWYQDRDITLLTNKTVTSIDPSSRTVKINGGTVCTYSRLVLAMGAEARLPVIKGLPSSKVYLLRTGNDALALKAAAEYKHHALLIGGGLLGLEAGYALTQLGLKVIVIEIAPYLLPNQLDEESAGLLQKKLMTLGFEFFVGTRIREIVTKESHIHLILESGVELTADFAVLSAGIAPNSRLAEDAGLAVGARGIMVNDHLKTSRQDIFAVGDVAEWRGKNYGLWTAAQSMGRIAGLNASGDAQVYDGVVPSTKLKVAGVDVSSQGNINPEGARIVGRRHEDDDSLVKLFIRHGELAGVLQIGYAAGVTKYKKLIEKKIPVDGYEAVLLEKEPSFERIPGFN